MGDGTTARPVMPVRKRSGDAAHHITEECERLFCETLSTLFLVEKDMEAENSLSMDALYLKNGRMGEDTQGGNTAVVVGYTAVQNVPGARGRVRPIDDLPTPSTSPGARTYKAVTDPIRAYMEMYDYAGDARFRGFAAEKGSECALFVFFDREVIGQDLKPGLTALLELASVDGLDCDKLVVCVDRTAESEGTSDFVKDLGWVGFELTTLDPWTGSEASTSDRWIFLSMDV